MTAPVPSCDVCEAPVEVQIWPGSTCSDCRLLVLDAMERYGGSFVSALGAAWRRADVQNHTILLEAFPEIWKRYVEHARRDRARALAQKGGAA